MNNSVLYVLVIGAVLWLLSMSIMGVVMRLFSVGRITGQLMGG
jgi:hypothetical protein